VTNSGPAAVGELVAFSWNWLILLIPFFIGILAGIQTFYAQAGSDGPNLLKTAAGVFYWSSRGVVPVATYLVWFFLRDPHIHSVIAAISSGLGSEAVLRSRFYFGEKKASGGKSEEVFKGVFDLLAWYQGLLLKLAGEQAAEGRQKFVENLMKGETNVPQLVQRAKTNAKAWPIKEEEDKLQSMLDSFLTRFQKELIADPPPDLAQFHHEYIMELGYAAMRLTRRKSLKVLFKK
jgi:hypothetical protein